MGPNRHFDPEKSKIEGILQKKLQEEESLRSGTKLYSGLIQDIWNQEQWREAFNLVYRRGCPVEQLYLEVAQKRKELLANLSN
jgi:hypothetical protein